MEELEKYSLDEPMEETSLQEKSGMRGSRVHENEPIDPARRLFVEDDNEKDNQSVHDDIDGDENCDTQKIVRFRYDDKGKPIEIDNENNQNPQNHAVKPWQFAEIMQDEIPRRLPINHTIKRWKKNNSKLVGNMLQVLQKNGSEAIENLMNQNVEQLQELASGNPKEIDRIRRHKQKLLGRIITKIGKRLYRTPFPSRLSGDELDPEYIVSKRHFLQRRLNQELHNCEKLELEVNRQMALLKEVTELSHSYKQSVERKIKEKLIPSKLHPTLSQSLQDSYGVIKTNDILQASVTSNSFNRDRIELNLKLPKVPVQEESGETDNVDQLLPGYGLYKKASQNLSQSVDRVLNNLTKDNDNDSRLETNTNDSKI